MLDELDEIFKASKKDMARWKSPDQGSGQLGASPNATTNSLWDPRPVTRPLWAPEGPTILYDF